MRLQTVKCRQCGANFITSDPQDTCDNCLHERLETLRKVDDKNKLQIHAASQHARAVYEHFEGPYLDERTEAQR